MRRLEITSPAKLNLYLRIIKERSDGYHELVTLFERIDLADYISIEKTRKGIVLVSENKDLPIARNNLAFKAAAIFLQKIRKNLGVKIKIFKNIPIGAGLGGGSSNAAAVLLGINRIYDLGLDKSVLAKWGREIGSDVNFFLDGKNFALGKGRGEKIYPLDFNTRLWHVLIYPNIRISTKDIYNSFERGLTKKAVDVKIMLTALKENRIDIIANALFNSLEETVLKKYPIVSFWKKKLSAARVKGALVTGSGSSIFGLVSDRKEGEAVKRELEKLRGAKIFVVSTQWFDSVLRQVVRQAHHPSNHPEQSRRIRRRFAITYVALRAP